MLQAVTPAKLLVVLIDPVFDTDTFPEEPPAPPA
jgi:hypothetical protein